MRRWFPPGEGRGAGCCVGCSVCLPAWVVVVGVAQHRKLVHLLSTTTTTTTSPNITVTSAFVPRPKHRQ